MLRRPCCRTLPGGPGRGKTDMTDIGLPPGPAAPSALSGQNTAQKTAQTMGPEGGLAAAAPLAETLKPTLRRTWRFVVMHWRRHWGLVLAIALATTLAAVLEIILPVFAGKLVDALSHTQTLGRDAVLDLALSALGMMVGLGVGMLLLRIGVYAGLTALTPRMMTDAALDTFRRVQKLSTDWHANTFVGSTVRKIGRGSWGFDELNDAILLAMLPSCAVLVGAVVMFALHWSLLGAVVLGGAAMYVAVTVSLSLLYVAPYATRANRWDSRMSAVMADAIGCNAVVKGFGAEEREERRLRRVQTGWKRRTRATWLRGTRSALVQQVMLVTLHATIVGLVVWFWWQGRASAGDLTLALTAYGVIHAHLSDIGHHIRTFQRAMNDLEDMAVLADWPLGVEDRPGAPALPRPRGEIRFETVSFTYPAQQRTVYRDFSLTIPAGQRVGLVGPSGSGKTTFIKLVQRLYDVDSGAVLLDDIDVRAVTQASLRRQIAIVQQEPLLFHRSLADNIRYARPDASMAEVEAAAALAHADVFIRRLPDGYATPVGERGVKLSGGERQRVALARAFLADAPILILDEATSSLDSESEAMIQDAMERLMQGRTTLVVAHRLSTIRSLDRILVFDQGVIREDGNHDTLMRISGGLYRRLVDRQNGGLIDG